MLDHNLNFGGFIYITSGYNLDFGEFILISLGYNLNFGGFLKNTCKL